MRYNSYKGAFRTIKNGTSREPDQGLHYFFAIGGFEALLKDGNYLNLVSVSIKILNFFSNSLKTDPSL